MFMFMSVIIKMDEKNRLNFISIGNLELKRFKILNIPWQFHLIFSFFLIIQNFPSNNYETNRNRCKYIVFRILTG